MAARARGRRSSHGIDGSILETSVGSAGKVLEADTREARRRKAEVRNLAPGAGGVQWRTTGTQEGFPRCRTVGEAACSRLAYGASGVVRSDTLVNSENPKCVSQVWDSLNETVRDIADSRGPPIDPKSPVRI